MNETITLPAGWVAITLDEYKYLLSLSLLHVKDTPKPQPKPEA